MRARELLAGAKFCNYRQHVVDRASHPLEPNVFEAFLGEPCAYLVVSEDRSVRAVGELFNEDACVDASSFGLLGDPLPHIARGLADLQLPLMLRIIDRVGVDLRPGVWPLDEDAVNR